MVLPFRLVFRIFPIDNYLLANRVIFAVTRVLSSIIFCSTFGAFCCGVVNNKYIV